MRKYKRKFLPFLFSSLLLFFFSSFLFSASQLLSFSASSFTDPFLLMQPIRDSIRTGDFSHFKGICLARISVQLESPFELRGYVPIAKFIEDFSSEYSLYKAERIEWSSKQIEENYAVQSLNVILKDKRSEKEIYYKFIFFMKKRLKQWKIYYLRGLRL